MAKEVRIIQFEHHEVVAATQAFIAQRTNSGDTAAITQVRLSEDNDGVRGELRSGRNPEGSSRTMSGDDMLVAMLLYCSRKRIPLPIRAAKRLEMRDASLMLRITLQSR